MEFAIICCNVLCTHPGTVSILVSSLLTLLTLSFMTIFMYFYKQVLISKNVDSISGTENTSKLDETKTTNKGRKLILSEHKNI